MTLIEGVGDEVTQFFGAIFLLLLGLAAWWSTRISDHYAPPVLLVFERRAQNDSRPTVTNQPERRADDESRRVASDEPRLGCATAVDSDSVASGKAEEAVAATVESAAAVAEADDVTTMDEDAAADRREDDRPATDEPTHDGDEIRIRLKYLNDDQKLVRGKLTELLGDFKRRHFSVELSHEKRVRLIFNGQVLQTDEQTLGGCGLYDNCVVHCLIHQQVNTNNRASPQQQTNPNAAAPEWNLGFLLFCGLSLLLGLFWFLRFHYSQLFTLTTTTILTVLTAMYALSAVGTYLHDFETPAA